MVEDGGVEFSFTNNFAGRKYIASVSTSYDMSYIYDSVTLDCTAILSDASCFGFLTAPSDGVDPIYFFLSNNDGSNLIKKTVSNPPSPTVKYDPIE